MMHILSDTEKFDVAIVVGEVSSNYPIKVGLPALRRRVKHSVPTR